MTTTVAYLDNAATTPATAQVCEAVRDALAVTFGNPSSLHSAGLAAEDLVSRARRQLALALGVRDREIVFTSGGTEADNMAVFGVAHAAKRRGQHIVTTAVEHAAILRPCAALESMGWRVTRVGVDSTGRVSPAAVAEAVCEETVLVSVMAVNNEVGSVQPLQEIVAAVREKKRDVIIHSDAIQAFMKVPFSPRRLGLDMATVSAHKLHGPKGVGALWIREGCRVDPLLYGGEQEGGRRAGTENVPGIAGFGTAVAEMVEAGEAARSHMAHLRHLLLTGILEQIEGAKVNSDISGGAPHILSVSFPGLRSEVLVHALAQEGVYVSAGAACSERRNAESHVLKAMGLTAVEITGTLRLSLSHLTTHAEVEKALGDLTKVVRRLGGIKRQ